MKLFVKVILFIVLIDCVAVLGALIMPKVFSAQEKANITVCTSNLKNLNIAIHEYHKSNKVYPDSFEDLRPGFVDLDLVLECPSCSEDPVGFIYLGVPKNWKGDQTELIIMHDKLGNHEGYNLSYLDGHGEFVDEDRFEELMAQRKSLEASGEN